LVTVSNPAAQQQTSPETEATGAPGARTAAFFDLDKTIIAKSSTLAFSKPFFDQGLLNRRAVLKSTYAQFIFLLSGADHDQMDRMRAHMTNMCTGWDAEQVKSIVNETLHEIVTPLVFAEAADLIAAHKLYGRDVVVVSASGEEIVAPIARALGATHAMATRMVVEDGKYTGEVAFYCYGEGKVQAIRELAAREGYPLEHCYAYRRAPECGQPRPRIAQRSGRAGLARVDVLEAGVPARPDPGTVGRRDRYHRRGGGQRAGRRGDHVLVVAPLRVLARVRARTSKHPIEASHFAS
jgi:HAD superfamily hydrolase (TIGR01490 family)